MQSIESRVDFGSGRDAASRQPKGRDRGQPWLGTVRRSLLRKAEIGQHAEMVCQTSSPGTSAKNGQSGGTHRVDAQTRYSERGPALNSSELWIISRTGAKLSLSQNTKRSALATWSEF